MLLPVHRSCFASVYGYVKEGPDHRRSLSPPAVTKGSTEFHSLFPRVVLKIQSITRRNIKGDSKHPCQMPAVTLKQSESWPLCTTLHDIPP